MVCVGLPAFRGVVGHHAPSILLGDLDSFIALSLESHRYLRISIIDSIVGDFPAVRSSSLFVRDPFLLYIPHRPPAYLAETTTVVKRFQFQRVLFFQGPAFAPLECYIDNRRLLEPFTDVRLSFLKSGRTVLSIFARVWVDLRVESSQSVAYGFPPFRSVLFQLTVRDSSHIIKILNLKLLCIIIQMYVV
jgi:hypothetical protein